MINEIVDTKSITLSLTLEFNLSDQILVQRFTTYIMQVRLSLVKFPIHHIDSFARALNILHSLSLISVKTFMPLILFHSNCRCNAE